MKTTLFVLFLFCATAAFSQAFGPVGAVMSNQPVVFEIAGHPEHASPQSLAAPQYLNESTGSTFAQGVQPLWEFPVLQEEVSLGEAARVLRQQHAMAKKAEIYFSDQK